MPRRNGLTLTVAVLVVLLAATAAAAQSTACKTGNCMAGRDGSGNPILPEECKNIASPRLVKVDMDDATLSFYPVKSPH